MLPNSARIKSSSDFARVTKSGRRFTTESLIGYLYSPNSLNDSNPNLNTGSTAKLGLIVGKPIGNSVVRHRIARQIRHSVRERLKTFPKGSLLVIRAVKRPTNAFTEGEELITKIEKSLVNA